MGLDLAVTRLATLSTGEILADPREGKCRARAIAAAQRALARTRNGSKRRLRLKHRLSALRQREADARTTALHRHSARLVRRFSTIAVERPQPCCHEAIGSRDTRTDCAADRNIARGIDGIFAADHGPKL